METSELNLIVVYLPESALESVKQALFNAGAGQYPGYDQCCWQTLGQGQFRPLADSNPTLGLHHQLTTVPEYRLELVCHNQSLAACIQALKANHPYEVPAYHILKFHV